MAVKDKDVIRDIIGVRTGGYKLQWQLNLLSMEARPICQNCLTEEESAYHFLGICDRWGVPGQNM